MSEHKTFFKEPRRSRKVTRLLKRESRATKEASEKDKVRKADGYCRFPSCGCRKFKLALHVAHLEHKGMGGNPAGDRSEVGKMILLCAARHRENQVSLDQGTVRIRPLTPAGTRGPCAFDIDLRAITSGEQPRDPVWMEIARERAPHSFEPAARDQVEALAGLRKMTV